MEQATLAYIIVGIMVAGGLIGFIFEAWPVILMVLIVAGLIVIGPIGWAILFLIAISR